MRDFSWIIVPAVFVVLYVLLGIYAWDHLYYVLVSINGHVLVAMPPHWQTYYNSRDGPVSSIFLSNYLFDGWNNLWVFIIYLAVFVMTNIYVSGRLSRAGFLVIGAMLSSFVAGGVIRFIFAPGQIGYGQSAVLSGFAGITVYFLAENLLIRDTRKKVLHNPVGGSAYIALSIIGIFLLSVFVIATPLAIVVHLSAMASGIALAGLYSVILRKRDKTRNRKMAILIPEKVRA